MWAYDRACAYRSGERTSENLPVWTYSAYGSGESIHKRLPMSADKRAVNHRNGNIYVISGN